MSLEIPEQPGPADGVDNERHAHQRAEEGKELQLDDRWWIGWRIDHEGDHATECTEAAPEQDERPDRMGGSE